MPFNFPLEAIIKMDVTRGGGTHHPGDGVVVDPSAVLNPNDPHSNSSASIVSPGLTQKPNLLPSPLKLVVMQRMDGGDAGSVPQNPKLGEVSLNLAEYVGKGKVERRFLLKESRVNATLKVRFLFHFQSIHFILAIAIYGFSVMMAFVRVLRSHHNPRILAGVGPKYI